MWLIKFSDYIFVYSVVSGFIMYSFEIVSGEFVILSIMIFKVIK